MNLLIRFLAKLLALVLSIFFSLWPARVRWFFARGISFIAFDVFGVRRFTILKNISLVFPQKTHAERLSLARVSLSHLSLNFIEFCLLPQVNQRWCDKNLIVHGWDHYEQARQRNKGVLFLGLHLGNGDVGIAVLSLLGIRINSISKKFKNLFANEFWFGVREKMGTRFLAPHGKNLAFDILKACRQKEAVIFVIDQFMGPPYGMATTFFGKATGTAYGLSLFSIKTGAPVVPVYVYRDEKFKTHLVFQPAVEAVADENKDLQLQKTTQKYNDILEKIILQHPEQWMWMHRRWKTFS
jgi:KDO2-lipid IV(A) lauroyltransferase